MKLRTVKPSLWEIKREGQMKVPVRIYASEELLEKMKQDRTLGQAVNVASMPGVLPNVLVMPDGHEGYGFPIGGVAAFPAEGGLVSPGGIGYDINCGMRLLKTGLDRDALDMEKLLSVLFDTVPSGVGSESSFRVDREDFIELVTSGVRWAVRQGYASEHDSTLIEENGSMPTSADSVGQKAVSRGLKQIGTLGAGNHFLEVQEVDKVFSPVAEKFGIRGGQVTVMIHTGSRGFGHQVAGDHIKNMLHNVGRLGIPDRELAAARLDSKEGESYLSAMKCAVNFAFVNRQMITHNVRGVFDDLLGEKLELLYDVAHNIGKFEEHGEDLFVHRKGATRAFGPGRKELPDEYRRTGQPVIIPGSMGTASYVLVGLGNRESFESTCHGAGRVMSRSAAKRRLSGENIQRRLAKKGISVRAQRASLLAEEAPEAYKDIDEVVRVVAEAGISAPVARLVPLGVVKG